MSDKEFIKYQGILFVGPPYSGKGSQCELLKGPYYHHFSSGEAFRSLDLTTDLGLRVHKLLEKHEFVSDEDTVSLVKDKLYKHVQQGLIEPKTQYLLQDGFPRNIEQISLLDFIVTKQVFHFIGLTNKMAYDRANHRVKEAEKLSKKPRIEDQSHEAIDKRIYDFNTKTFPIIPVYQNMGIEVIEIDCGQPKEIVSKKIKEMVLSKKD
jgi:adenylate kinase